MKRLFSLLFMALFLIGSNITAPALAEPVRGAIFTTVSDGSVVNANLFASKCEVYLDGGPGPNAPAKAASLTDGEYYFQVTDPSGKKLLSTDPVSNRRFQVRNGVIAAYTGDGGPAHPTGIDRDHSGLGAITIRLANVGCPADFLESPNDGGTYKVWATPVGDFAGDPTLVDNECGGGCAHGFIPAKSKTDNFKVKGGTTTFCVTVQKQYRESNGLFSPKEGWPIYLLDPRGVNNTYYTDSSGQLQICGLTPGLYQVAESLDYPVGTTSQAVGLVVNGLSLPAQPAYSFTWKAGQPAPVIVFFNAPSGGGVPD